MARAFYRTRIAAVWLALLGGCSLLNDKVTPHQDDTTTTTTARPPTWPEVGEQASATISTQGGTLELGALALELPSDSLLKDVEISVTVVSDDNAGDIAPASAIYAFEPAGLVFEKPVTVAFPADESLATATVYWTTLEDPSVFAPVPSYYDNGRVIASVTHFSRGYLGATCLGEGCPCEFSDADCAKYEDGNVCNGVLYCQKDVGKCAVNPATIYDCSGLSTACTESVCNPATAKCVAIPRKDDLACGEGTYCRGPDVCREGVCEQGSFQTELCACEFEKDCAAFEDGDACNGTLYCDGEKHECVVNPASIVICKDVDDTMCSQNLCTSANGQCKMTAVNEGEVCSTGSMCRPGTCVKGECIGGESICECEEDADCADKNSLCTGLYYCDKETGVCELNKSTVVECPSDDDTYCSKNTCDEKTGKCAQKADHEAEACDSDDACYAATCIKGICTKSTETECECAIDADCASQEDGNLCNGTLYCDLSVFPTACEVNPATVIMCPTVDDTACNQSTCNPTTGECAMADVADNTVCESENPCYSANCQSGVCVTLDDTLCECEADADCDAFEDGDRCNGILYCDKSDLPFVCSVNPATIVTCDDASDTECEVNTCDPTSGECALTDTDPACECQVDSDCVDADDGDLCNGTYICDTSSAPYTCIFDESTVVTCDTAEDTACSVTSCNPDTGICAQETYADGTACDYSENPCEPGACASGLCEAAASECDCATDADCASLDDANLCNGSYHCNSDTYPYVCEIDPSTVVDCPEVSDFCLTQTCIAETGVCDQTFADSGLACDAGDSPCTTDSCDGAGNCVPDPSTCPCSADSDCDVYEDYCTGPWYCQSAEVSYCNVVGGGPCDSDNPCIYDGCTTPANVCDHTNAPYGESCGTGMICDGNGACVSE